MAISFNSVFKKCGISSLIFAITALMAVFSAQAVSDTISTEQLKKEILSDPIFLNQLRDQLSANSIREDGVRKTVREYLLKNPEILLEMQETLEARNSQKIAENQAVIIKNSAKQLFHSADDAVFGNVNGDVTIVEFYDYNCGYCKRSFPAMQALLKSDPKIRFVMKDYPILGEDSVQAHMVARAFQKLMPRKYQVFHEKLMTHKGRATQTSAMEIALSLGADKNSLEKIIKDRTLAESLANNAEIAYKLGINYTPSYIIGERIIPGAVKADDLIAIIAEERNKER